MPGTVPKATDPILVTSTLNASVGQQQQAPLDSTAPHRGAKAALYADPEASDLVVTSAPSGHPAAGVASTGAAQLSLAGAATSALAPTNSPAQAMAASPSARSGASGDKKGSKKGANAASASKKDAELVKFIETNGHFSLVRNFHLADAFTLMNGFCGAQSLFASARYLISSDPRHAWTALWFPLFGAVFDLLDGKVARWRNSSSMLGQELDSLADSVRVRAFVIRDSIAE